MKHSILLVDDPLSQAGIQSILEPELDLQVVDVAEDGEIAIDKASEKRPDVVILDSTIGGISCIDTARKIVQNHPETKVIALSNDTGQPFAKDLLKAGVVGYLMKEDVLEELGIAIRKVLGGDIYLSSRITRQMITGTELEKAGSFSRVLLTKLVKPPVTDDCINRSRIIEELEANIVKPLTLVSAGAGYGKSIAISQWLDQTKYPHCWISLDDEHNDLQVFLTYLVEAIHKIVPKALLETSDAVSSVTLPPLKQLSNIVFNNLSEIDKELIVVLDDFHNINNPLVYQFLNEWLLFPPVNIHLAILTRRDPPLKLQSLRFHGRLTEIRMEDLSFTANEISLLFQKLKDIELDHASGQFLLERTEGWIVALRLVSMIIKQPEDIEKVMFLDPTQGGLGSVSEYLLSEVVPSLPSQFRDQLLKSSILNRFCAELLDYIGADDSRGLESINDGSEFIKWLLQANMFVIPLDLNGKWLRYHHLFQDLLQAQLKKRVDGDVIEMLHLKASSWFEEYGFLEEAMNHALIPKRYDRAIEIIKKNRITLLNSAEWHLLQRLFQRIPVKIIESQAELLLVDAYLSFYNADHKGVGSAVEKMKLLGDDWESYPMFRGEYHFFLGYVTIYLKNDPPTSLQYMERALDEIPESSSEPRALVELFYPVFCQIAGQYDHALKWLLKAINHSDQLVPIRKNRLYLSLFLTSTAQVELHQVLQYAERGLAIARESNMKDSLGTCLMMVGELYLRKGEWLRAIPYLEEVLSLKYHVHTRSVEDCIIGLLVINTILRREDRCKELLKGMDSFAGDLPDNHKRFVWSGQLRYYLLQNNLKKVRELVAQYHPDFLHLVFWIDVPEITYVKALIVLGTEQDLSLARKELQYLVEKASEQNNDIHLLEIYMLKALLYDATGDSEIAKQSLTDSIEIADRGQIITPFIEMGNKVEHLMDQMSEEFNGRPIVVQIRQKLTELTLLDEKKEVIADRPNIEVNALTQRELDVLHCLAKGLRNKEIANELNNSEETVKKHIYHMFQKLHVKNRMSLVTKAKEEGILE